MVAGKPAGGRSGHAGRGNRGRSVTVRDTLKLVGSLHNPCHGRVIVTGVFGIDDLRCAPDRFAAFGMRAADRGGQAFGC